MTGEGCLLIDNSNTRTKLMLCRPGAEVEVRILPTAEISHESLSRVLSGWSFERVCLCSVVPWAAKVIADCVGDVEFHQMDVESATGVDFSTYPGRATLGADRVANVLAAVQRVPLPLVAVDLGTAATFDVVVQGGAWSGVLRWYCCAGLVCCGWESGKCYCYVASRGDEYRWADYRSYYPGVNVCCGACRVPRYGGCLALRYRI